MHIQKVTLTVARPDEAAAFYRDVLELPVDTGDGRVTVRVGSSVVVLEHGRTFPGVHHLAFGIAPADVALAQEWLGGRVQPIVVEGSAIIQGPPGWNSRSLYFLGPENIVLELIARDAHGAFPPTQGSSPALLSLSEVGIGVPDVAEAVCALTEDLGLPTFPPQEARFAPVGDHDGLIILVEQERVWFPTEIHRAARGPVTVELAAPLAGRLSLRPSAAIIAG